MTKTVALFLWSLFGCGASYFAYHAVFGQKAFNQRVICALLAITLMSIGVLLTLRSASSVAALIASASLVAAVVFGYVVKIAQR